MSLPDNHPKPLDLKAWLARRRAEDEAKGVDFSAPPVPPAAAHTSGGNYHQDQQSKQAVISYAATALAREADSVARAQPGERNNALNKAAYSCYQLVGSGALDAAEVDRVLTFAAKSIGLPDDEIRKTIGSARDKGMASPRDLSSVGTQNNNHVHVIDFHEYNANILGNDGAFSIDLAGEPIAGKLVIPHGNGHANGNSHAHNGHRDEPTAIPAGMEDNPHYLAQLFANRMQHPDGPRLRFWRDEFHWWDGVAYRTTPAKEIRAEITQFVAKKFLTIYNEQMRLYGMQKGRNNGGGDDDSGDEKKGPGRPAGPPKPIPVTTRLIGDVLQALSGIALLPGSLYQTQPAWIHREGIAHEWPANEMLPARNGLVHLPSAVANLPCMLPPTPLYFSAYALSYDADPLAGAPPEWTGFLNRLWPDDPSSITTLQEWMGYLLTPDTNHQKIMVITGPPRSGKGTIANVIDAMVGHENIVNPTLSSLSSQFGLEPLLNKTIAIITDARISNRTDTSIAIERLLSISGQDSQTVARKHTSSITTKLTTRFTLISNLVPNLQDASGALASRMIFLKLTESFLGREILRLFEDRLVPELPGILRWAIGGWASLRDRGFFVQPESGREEKETMEDLSSPVSAYLRECCELGEGDQFVTPKAELFNSWKSWCESKGMKNPGSQEVFGRNLRSITNRVKSSRPREDGKQIHSYSGIRVLNPPPAEFSGQVDLSDEKIGQYREQGNQDRYEIHKQYKDYDEHDE